MQRANLEPETTSAVRNSAGGYAALTLFADDTEVLMVAYELNLVAPAAGNMLEELGTVIKAGRTLTVCTLKVFDVENARKLVAVGQQTLIRVSV